MKWPSIIILIILMAAVLALIYFFGKKHKDNPDLSYGQNRVEDQLGNGALSFSDPYAKTKKDISFQNKQGSVQSDGAIKGTVNYRIVDVLEPINLDADKDLEYPFILQANYPDARNIDYLVIATKDAPNTIKFTANDQVAIGDPAKINDIHSLDNKEVVIDAYVYYDDGTKDSTILTYTFQSEKIVPGKDNIDIDKTIIKQKPVPVTQKKSDSSSSNTPPDTKGKIALTFDDGPGVHTPEILDILKNNDVKATFFMIGQNAEGRHDFVKRVHNEGHIIGNHTYDHQQMSKFSYDKQKDEIQKTNDILKGIISGLNVHWFRPPYGDYNDDTMKVLSDLGMERVLWNVDPRDWSGVKAQDIIDNVLANTKDGSIVLMHDGVANSSETAKALPTIIKELKNKGYKLVTVSELKGYNK